MMNDTNIKITLPWPALALIAAVLVYVCLGIFAQFLPVSLFVLLIIVLGVTTSVAGLILTKRSHYEVFPTRLQIIGALGNGVLLAALFITLMLVLERSLTAAFFLVSLVPLIEFLFQRSFQSKKISVYRLAAVALVAVALYLFISQVPTLQPLFMFFIGALIVKALVSRYTRTYVLSPWVSSIWNGLSFAVAGLIMVFMIMPGALDLSTKEILADVMMLPIWAGLLAIGGSLLLIVIQFIKRKTAIASGYLQHKVQWWILLLLGAAFLFGGLTDITLIGSFLLLVAAVSVAEQSIFPVK